MAIFHEDLIRTLSGSLTHLGYRMATAESCTGGMIATICTGVAGSSTWFTGGVVTYANELKGKLLGVPAAVLMRHGAVSGEVVQHMAAGALYVCGAQAAVAVSGVAGPDGGSPEKPVGTVWIAVAVEERPGVCEFDLDDLSLSLPCLRVTVVDRTIVLYAVRQFFNGSRADIRQQTTARALWELSTFLKKNTVA